MRCLLSLFLASASVASAAPLPAPLRHSEQFTVIDARPVSALSPGPLTSKSGEALIRLDADVLLLSAERIKETLLGELALSPEGAGKVRLLIYTASNPENLIGVAAGWSPSGWDYRIEVPDQVEGRKLVRGIVHGLLLELANRGQGPRSAELPVWLVEGLGAHMLSVAGRELVVGSVPLGSMLRIVSERRGLDYLQGARQVLSLHRPLTFPQLAYPAPESLAGERLATFQASAHLFVYELLHTRNGPANLLAMLRELPKCYNWETAFLRGFATEFKSMLDVEKKWSVDALAFTAHDPSQVWSKVLCLDRLDELLSVSTQVRAERDRLPERKKMSLQEMIRTLPFGSQTGVLRQKLLLLEVLRFHATADLVPLIDSYHHTLAVYLEKRSQAGRTPETRMEATVSASLVAQEALRDLDQLDKRREGQRPERILSVNSPITR
jgi:hypothetical protein